MSSFIKPFLDPFNDFLSNNLLLFVAIVIWSLVVIEFIKLKKLLKNRILKKKAKSGSTNTWFSWKDFQTWEEERKELL